MIYDTLANLKRYEACHPRFKKVIEFLSRTDLNSLSEGRHDIDGDEIFVLVSACEGKGKAAGRLEAHRKYVDIQLCISGADCIGWKSLESCKQVVSDYDEEKDIVFFDDAITEWFAVKDDYCVVYFPEDAHAPLGSDEVMRKLVVKVAVS